MSSARTPIPPRTGPAAARIAPDKSPHTRIGQKPEALTTGGMTGETTPERKVGAKTAEDLLLKYNLPRFGR